MTKQLNEPEAPGTFQEQVFLYIKTSYLKLVLLIGYMIQDIKRGPLQLKIAVFSIFSIVAFMAFLLNANNLTITMFLTLAER